MRNTKKRTKYSNVKVVIDGIKIDSKKEGAHYYKLKDQLPLARYLTLPYSQNLILLRALS